MPPSLYSELHHSSADADTLREHSYVSTHDSLPSDETMASRSSTASDFGTGDGYDTSSANAMQETKSIKERKKLRGVLEKMVISFNGEEMRTVIASLFWSTSPVFNKLSIAHRAYVEG